MAEIDSDLVRAFEGAKAGNSRAWNKLVDLLQARVHSVIRRTGLGREDCEEVFAATFTALYQNLPRIESGPSVAGWVMVTASREAFRVSRITRKGKGIVVSDDLPLDEVIASEESRADELVLEAESAAAVRHAVSRLNDKCRELLESLYFSEEPSYEAIKERLGIPIGSIGPTRARCLERVRKLLVEEGFFESASKPSGVPS